MKIPKYARHEINCAGDPTEEGKARLMRGEPTPGYEEETRKQREEYAEKMKATATPDQIQRLARMAAGVHSHTLSDLDVIAIRALLSEVGAHRSAKERQEVERRVANYNAGVKDAAEVCFSAARLARTVIETNCFDVAHLYEVRGNEILALIPATPPTCKCNCHSEQFGAHKACGLKTNMYHEPCCITPETAS